VKRSCDHNPNRGHYFLLVDNSPQVSVLEQRYGANHKLARQTVSFETQDADAIKAITAAFIVGKL
jgi:hypothetical protein